MRGWALRALTLSALLLPYLILVDCTLRVMTFGSWGPLPPQCAVFFPEEHAATAAGQLISPSQIIPEAHMLMPYGVLRSINFGIGALDAKMLGLIAFYGSLIVPFTLSFLVWKRLSPAQVLLLIAAILASYTALAATSLFSASETIFQLGQALTAIWFGLFLIAVPAIATTQRRTAL
ncbi:MAG: hypothetical protein AAFQ22_04980 [Pseudomonadota bacterium]